MSLRFIGAVEFHLDPGMLVKRSGCHNLKPGLRLAKACCNGTLVPFTLSGGRRRDDIIHEYERRIGTIGGLLCDEHSRSRKIVQSPRLPGPTIVEGILIAPAFREIILEWEKRICVLAAPWEELSVEGA